MNYSEILSNKENNDLKLVEFARHNFFINYE